jgi:hypothetical protein
MRRLPFVVSVIFVGFAISIGAAAPVKPAPPRTFILRGEIHSVNPNSSPNGTFEIAAEPPARFIQTALRSYVERDTGRVLQEPRAFGFDGKRTIYQPNIPEYQGRRPDLVTATSDQERAIRSAAEEALRRIEVPLTSTDATPPDRVGPVRYSDYRTIDGVRVPFRIDLGHEIWTVRDAQINVDLPPKLFRR